MGVGGCVRVCWNNCFLASFWRAQDSRIPAGFLFWCFVFSNSCTCEFLCPVPLIGAFWRNIQLSSLFTSTDFIDFAVITFTVLLGVAGTVFC